MFYALWLQDIGKPIYNPPGKLLPYWPNFIAQEGAIYISGGERYQWSYPALDSVHCNTDLLSKMSPKI